MQVVLLEETVSADVSVRFAVRAAVVRDDIESPRYETLNDAGRTRAVVGDAVQIDDGGPADTRGPASPAVKMDAVA